MSGLAAVRAARPEDPGDSGGPRSLRIVVLAASGGSVPAAADVARHLAGSARGNETDVVVLPGPGTTPLDPFCLRAQLVGRDADAFVLVAPRRWGPHRSVPAPAIDGRAVALVQADSPADLPAPGTPATAAVPWIVAAMAKDVFLGPAGRWAETLGRAGCGVVDLRADRARRDDLVAALSTGPSVVLYAGHGRPRGWGGYQGVRWNHVDPASAGPCRPAGLVIAFACDTLKRSRNAAPFGSQVVAGGAAGAYLGAARALRTADVEELAEIVVGLLAVGTVPTVAHLVAMVDRSVPSSPGAARAWRRFRLVGDPSVPLRRGDASVSFRPTTGGAA